MSFPVRRIACPNCGETFMSAAMRAKWCADCAKEAAAVQRMRTALQSAERAGMDYASVQLRELIRVVAPKGMVTRAEYLQGKSIR